jgi:3-oxoadipate CoA-transferase beta subunit
MKRISRDQIAERLARDIPEGAIVNLGIGLPTKVANYLPADKDIFLQSEKRCARHGPGASAR